MLKSLDILIGIATVMLLFSMVVTVVTQAVTGFLNLRGAQLRKGLIDLLTHLDPAITQTIAKSISTAVLKHSLIADSAGRLGTVIHRDELTTLLMDIASGNPPTIQGDAKNVLAAALKNNGVADPQAALDSVRSIAMSLEESYPDLATHVRTTAAILQGAESKFVGKINAWFDQTMDRTIQRFTFHTRYIAFAGALVVAFGTQLDAVALLNRLSLDDSFRSASTKAAETAMIRFQVANGDATGQNKPDLKQATDGYYTVLSSAGVIVMPFGSGWRDQLTRQKVPGILFSALLLSLGAPFWYNALKNLLKLRSSLAANDDQQRQDRQTDTSTAGDQAAKRALTPPATSEVGDLTAVG